MELYTTSFYWTITTIATVGYGDIGGSNYGERIFCIIIMITGVSFFSYINGAIASIFQNYDNLNGSYEEK